mmetsp:Transcript_49849/g.57540  ORF Transcript_49849/g.57540 Transcript_49849/m.57540 type:complete len:1085 (+) Transcript_49849:234-3488(+)|eukprot:CAMPEP_0170773572 /NCGR_PEP_ID=MMETSP0733-20121128/9448_1 /TAXON_ID=186038 /ORGANISM="Fragilariopsis kerguelensis, Strain L26-C5" /LENGTH=1084 /DNA_ID=CAMNT_0011115975 /DNA_START=168 /DNA_END=3422 /DNA_ORIENTATION=+
MSLLDSAGIVNGDIWCNGAFSFESPLKDLLDSGEYTLDQLLAEDELLQELRGVHPQLIEFFSSEEAVTGLIRYVILPPKYFSSAIEEERVDDKDNSESDNIVLSTSGDGCAKPMESNHNSNDRIEEEIEATKQTGKWLEGNSTAEHDQGITQRTKEEERDAIYIRYPYMACEVICCEIKGIIDILVGGFIPSFEENEEKEDKPDTDRKRILDLLFSILYDSKSREIDNYRAGYFEKILSILFRNRPKEIAQYLNDGGGKGNVTLMSALFRHLYSHSLMQIVQRLLLPQPPVAPQNPAVIEQSNECENLFHDTLEGADIDLFDSFRCNWSESEIALQMILDCLIGNKTTDIKIEVDEERKLNLYQNASEVLITIIQNSPLTSHTLHSLTTDPIMEKLIIAATYVETGSYFSRHDSRLTCVMSVLESLILQLGGYGSVGTVMYTEEDNGEGAQDVTKEEIIGDTSMSGLEEGKTTNQQTQLNDFQNFATSETLIRHLPVVLSSLSNLLLYSGTEKWVSPMQFSKDKPQQILGSSRLRVVRLLESLVLLGNPEIDSLLCESSCLEVCLDLFWKFQWCSMLHQSVANLLVHVFEGQNSRSELQSYILLKCNLLGRLMYSFWDKADEGIASIVNDSNAVVSESLMAMKDKDNPPAPPSSVASEKGSMDEVLPVSDDDVDAAMEQQQDCISINVIDTEGSKYSDESNENKMEVNPMGDRYPAEFFRLGYMGHVIIICQALVHACTEDNDNNSPSLESHDYSEKMSVDGEIVEVNLRKDERESPKQDEDSGTLPGFSTDGSIPTSEASPNSHMLAQLVNMHPLGKIWQDFVSTTLASETVLQTTPLGGFQAPILGGTDPLHMHRPGLADDGGYDNDDIEAPPVPQRGLLVDGDVIDMNDNDLDVAASMMAGLSLGQVADNRGESQIDQSTPSQSNVLNQNRYIFDDPLGGERFGQFENDDGDSDSSDKVPEMSDNAGVLCENTTENDVPIMDLFAGNFDTFGETDSGDQQPSRNWSDFANFDDAFTGAQIVVNNPKKEETNDFDSIFGDVKSRDILLDNLENPSPFDNGTLSNDVVIDVKTNGGQQGSAGP